MMGHPNELNEDLEAAAPYLSKLALHLISHDAELSYGVLGFYLLALWLQEQKVSESKLLVQMMEAIISNRVDKIDFQLEVEKPQEERVDD